MRTTELLGKLSGVKDRGERKWQACCPVHGDNTPSLSIAEGERSLLLHCHAGCRFRDVVRALELRPGDLYYAAKTPFFTSLTSSVWAKPIRSSPLEDEADLLLIDTLLESLLSQPHDPVAFYGWSEDERRGQDEDRAALDIVVAYRLPSNRCG